MESKTETTVRQAKGIIAPGTPSPRKRKRAESPVPAGCAHHRPLKRPELPPVHLPRASNLLSALKADSGVGNFDGESADASHRDTTQGVRPQRDAQTLAIIENLEIGPYEHLAPSDDPNFNGLEPHSSIRLSQRITAHDDVSELLTGRHYLSPSTLYSIVRPSTNRQGYDVPVDGEWVTIAVVAERGPIRLSQTGGNDGPAEEKDSKDSGSTATKHRSGPRKHTTIKLIDMGGASSDGKGKAVRGDAYLNMLLFEADSASTSKHDSSRKVERSYKGGSGGAFENSARFSEGSVIAICSPRLLKPYQSGNDQLHPKLNVLGLTPTNAASITVIGRARDLGHCNSLKKDGKACGSWCDLRVAKVCDYHLQQAVQSRRAGRAEFSVSTSGMSTGGGRKTSGSYDPSQKRGLLPKGAQSVPKTAQNLSADTGAMYIVGSQVIRPLKADIAMDEFVAEKLGREKQGQQQRRRERLDEEERLNKLLSRDGGLTTGAKALNQALGINSKGASDADGNTSRNTSKSGFSAEAVKHIGFDPSGTKQAQTDADVKRKLGMLEDLQKMNRTISLAKRPSTSTSSTSNLDTAAEESTAPPSATGEDDDESELEIEG